MLNAIKPITIDNHLQIGLITTKVTRIVKTIKHKFKKQNQSALVLVKITQIQSYIAGKRYRPVGFLE